MALSLFCALGCRGPGFVSRFGAGGGLQGGRPIQVRHDRRQRGIGATAWRTARGHAGVSPAQLAAMPRRLRRSQGPTRLPVASMVDGIRQCRRCWRSGLARAHAGDEVRAHAGGEVGSGCARPCGLGPVRARAAGEAGWRARPAPLVRWAHGWDYCRGRLGHRRHQW